MARPAHILPVIVFAQFAGTSLWFAGNAVLPQLQQAWGLEASAVGQMTSSVQLGFIAGTLVFALLNVADRLPARAVFLGSALVGGAATAGITLVDGHLAALLGLRALTGFCLAGIYPVGMKIAASWHERGLGRALGLLVGALVLGTAFPHLLRAGGLQLPWETVLLGVSALAALGGLLLFLTVPAGPYLPRGGRFDPHALRAVFATREFRAAAFGYFGHMWELYAFWALLPALLTTYGGVDVSLWSFLIIAAGAVGCAAGGVASEHLGSVRVAGALLTTSGLLCVAAPALVALPEPWFLAALLLWGFAVSGDSPQFSTLSARHAPPERVGTALTVTTSVGFALTIPSIELLARLFEAVGPGVALVALAPGPALGLLALRSGAREGLE